MKILGIETSCDETGICLIETDSDFSNVKNLSTSSRQVKILGNQLYSQVAMHTQFGGVVPMMAKREHAKNLTPLLEKCLEEAGLIKSKVESLKSKVGEEKEEKIKEILFRENDLFEQLKNLAEKIERPDIDAIAVTNGPGLEPALWVGVVFAKALSEIWNIPVIPTNHMEGHVVVAQLQQHDESKVESYKVIKPEVEKTNIRYSTFNILPVSYPAIALLISGGHTQLVLIKDNLQYEIIGNTKDDAVGEAFDKVARLLGLPYPGGRLVSELAEKERNEFPNKIPPYPLPRPMIHSKDLDFSFSGIKTAVLYTIKKIQGLSQASSSDEARLSPEISASIKQEIACEFENAVVEVLISKTKKAIEQYGAQTLIIGGGVSANKKIRNDFEKESKNLGINFLVPEVKSSTDNAVMIAIAGLLNIQAGKQPEVDFKANGNLSL
ncbi:MAG: tRNA (adenosine(37)-N6)-threonylcarbamoyltransferase complex transferase subunit TsaD [Candidatus Taylorbacteria bacterium]|nr:tRNA (adenosine(37)-N6)-threonylcarbamoyltransferase complex transferase subunit TsaD [Candidatus Taylorbacteria bacterium]